MEWDDLHRLISLAGQMEFEDSLYGVCRLADPEYLGNRIAARVCEVLYRRGKQVTIGVPDVYPDEKDGRYVDQ